jgi:hypothetical protein
LVVVLASLMVHNILDLVLLFTLDDVMWWTSSFIDQRMKVVVEQCRL